MGDRKGDRKLMPAAIVRTGSTHLTSHGARCMREAGNQGPPVACHDPCLPEDSPKQDHLANPWVNRQGRQVVAQRCQALRVLVQRLLEGTATVEGVGSRHHHVRASLHTHLQVGQAINRVENGGFGWRVDGRRCSAGTECSAPSQKPAGSQVIGTPPRT